MSKILTDSQLAALNQQKHISLTANAGSGKTFVLSTRYLNIILNKNISLRNIAAITFTDKAAGELYRKIAAEVDSRLQKEKDSKARKRLENIRAQLVSANISTIHSFCTDILREFPVEAGIDANFIPIDSRISNELIELVIEDVIKSNFNDPDESENIKYLIRIFGSKSNLAKEAANLLHNRKNVLVIKEKIYDGKNEEQIAAFFREQFNQYRDQLFLNNLGSIIQSLSKINETVLSEHPGNELALSITPLIEELSNSVLSGEIRERLQNIFRLMMTKSGTVARQKYLNNKINTDLEEETDFLESFYKDISKISADTESEKIEYELAYFGKKLIRLFEGIYQKYEKRKAESGYLDYEDILLYTKNILTKKEVQNYLSNKYSYLMIDEYQDTNEIQYDIFLPILDYLKKGNLFVVGDEKQSIYMFRDAELEVFLRTKNEISSFEGQDALLSLPHSFRMTPVPAAFINHLFGRLFNNPNPLFNEVQHSEIICARDTDIEGGVEFLIDKSRIDEKLPSEAELVARRIVSIVNSGYLGQNYNWNDIAILVRKRSGFKGIEEAFVQYNIPFSVVGGTGFYQKQVVYDIYNFFSFLADPGNDTALVGLLRSPFFNLSDSKIFEISVVNCGNYFNRLTKYAEKDRETARISGMLRNYLSMVKGHQSDHLLRKILSETPYISVISSRINGPQEMANLEKLINLTTNFFAAGFRTLYDYITFLSDAIKGIEDESQAALSDESNTVKMMTLHQAKGLEFPVVFLYNAHVEGRGSAAAAKQITIDKNFGLLTKLPPDNDPSRKYISAPILTVSDHINARKNNAELKRLLYVGMTRARDFLFVSAGVDEKKNFRKGSFMNLIDSALKADWNTSKIKFSETLKLLRLRDEKYESSLMTINKDVPLVSDIEVQTFVEKETISRGIPDKIHIDEIRDSVKGEIISATKVARFSQCPLKYYLTYETGFIRLMNLINEYKNRDDSSSFEVYSDLSEPEELRILAEGDEAVQFNYSSVVGSIIHSLLQKEVTAESLESSAITEIKNHLGEIGANEDISNKILNEIISVMSVYFSSEVYKYVRSFNQYRNEYEVYLKHNDFYLIGIIDKLIFSKDRIIIIDYKTDNIRENEFEAKAKTYLIQLKFYCYILSRLFRENKLFELKLIFLRHPGKEIIYKLSADAVKETADEINLILERIYRREFPKNTKHCPECIFSINNKCIAESDLKEYEKADY